MNPLSYVTPGYLDTWPLIDRHWPPDRWHPRITVAANGRQLAAVSPGIQPLRLQGGNSHA